MYNKPIYKLTQLIKTQHQLICFSMLRISTLDYNNSQVKILVITFTACYMGTTEGEYFILHCFIFFLGYNMLINSENTVHSKFGGIRSLEFILPLFFKFIFSFFICTKMLGFSPLVVSELWKN